MRKLIAFKELVEENNCAGSRPGRRFLLQWHVTERCNNHCTHCYQESYRDSELTLPYLAKVADQYEELLDFKRCPRGHITITGGEPFMREDFPDFLSLIFSRRHRFSFSVLTNGSLIDRNTARLLKSFKPVYVQVSLDGNKTTHDGIRGKGDFERTVKAIRELRCHNIPVMISFTAQKSNLSHFEEVARIGIRLKVSKVWTDRFIPCGGARGMTGEVLLPCETRDFFSAVRRVKRETHKAFFHKTEIAMARALQFLAEGGEPYQCAAGNTLLTVQANGDLLPCRRMPVAVGNVLQDSMKKLYIESPFLADLRDRERVSRGCEGCFYALLCRGGLRCLSYALFNDPFRRDPGCWLDSDIMNYAATGFRASERGQHNEAVCQQV